jgi:hypothetical protein
LDRSAAGYMNDNLANFTRWFKEPLLELQQDSEAGFIIVMISLALLERYLREKSGVHERPSLDANFRTEFMRLFPSIGRDDLALKFWEVCRHGLMHQTTFKIGTKAGHSVTMGLHESAPEIEYRYGSSGDEFMISPSRFCSRVIQIIENDFPTFEGAASPNHPLSQLSSVSGYSGFSGQKR